ncbi:hypothetical protein ACLOJK_024752 [Asimina triloba]
MSRRFNQLIYSPNCPVSLLSNEVSGPLVVLTSQAKSLHPTVNRATCRYVACSGLSRKPESKRGERREESGERARAEKAETGIKMGKIVIFLYLLLSSASSLLPFSSPRFRVSGDLDDEMAAVLGGVSDASTGRENNLEIEYLGRFAVDEHNKKENALLEFVRVVKAKEQTVAGKLHHLTLEAVEAGKKKLYEAKVWVKQWEGFKELQEFRHAGDGSFTHSDLGFKQVFLLHYLERSDKTQESSLGVQNGALGDHEPGWKEVPAHDPVVQDAANHAVKTIQQRSNSLAPYELLEILRARAEVIEDAAKFDMLLKLKRGSKEEKFKVEVHKNIEGTFHLNLMQPHEHSD